MTINDRANSILSKVNKSIDEEPKYLYCSNDEFKYYYSKPYLLNEYGVEAIKVKVVDREDNNNFVLMSPPVNTLEESNGISMFRINKIQEFVSRNLFIIYDLAREVDD